MPQPITTHQERRQPSTPRYPAHAALTAAHGTSGAIVGTTDTQTLTNKTLSNPLITGSANLNGATLNNGGTLLVDEITPTLPATVTITGNGATPDCSGNYSQNGTFLNDRPVFANGGYTLYLNGATWRILQTGNNSHRWDNGSDALSGATFSPGGTSTGNPTCGTFSATLDITATHFYGNGAGLTNVTGTDATKLPLAGGTMSGNIDMADSNITGINVLHCGTGGAIQVMSTLSMSGNTLNMRDGSGSLGGTLNMDGGNIWNVTGIFTDNGSTAYADSTKLPLAGGTMSGSIDMGAQDISNVGTLTANVITVGSLAQVSALSILGGGNGFDSAGNITANTVTATTFAGDGSALTGISDLPLAGGTMSGNIDMGGGTIVNTSQITLTSGATISPNTSSASLNIGGVSGITINFVGSPNVNMNNGGGSGGGTLSMDGGSIWNVTGIFTDNGSTAYATADPTKLPLAGGTMSGNIDMGDQSITNLNQLTLASGGTVTLSGGGSIDSSSNIICTTIAGDGSALTGLTEGQVSNLTTHLAAKAPLASPTFTGTVTTAAVSIGDASNIVLGTSTGTKIGTGTTQKIGFFNSTPVVQQSGNLITGLSNLGLLVSGSITEANVTNLTTDLAAKAPLASPTFTGTVTTAAVSIGDASNIALGTTTGTKIGTGTTQKIGFFNSTPVVQQTGNLITGLSNLGLLVSGSIAESDVTSLTSDLALKAPLASPTFTGTVTTAAVSIGDASNIVLGTSTGTKIGTGTTQKIGFFNSTPVVQQTGNLITGLSNLGLLVSGSIAESDVTSLTSDLALKAPLASPTFTGTVTTGTLNAGTFSATNFINERSATFDGNGAAVLAGSKVRLRIPIAGTIQKATMFGDVSGSAVLGIAKVAYSSYTGTGSGSSIVASAAPTITSATKSQDTTLTGWTTSVAANDILEFSVTSCSSITQLTISLEIKN